MKVSSCFFLNKSFYKVPLFAILVVSLASTSAFALSAEDELLQGLENPNEVFPFAQPVGASSVFSPSQVNVGTEIQFLVDTSDSINATEFGIQRDGYSSAFRSQDVIDIVSFFACPGLEPKGIAASFVYWSGPAQQQVAVDFSFINDAASSNAFADAIDATVRPFAGTTAPGSAINFAVPLFNNAFDGDRLVIDVSGDGAGNDGDDTATARDNAIAGVVDVINGIVISPTPGILAFYQVNVTGGAGSFVLEAATFVDFEQAIKEKIVLEIVECNGVGGEFLPIDSTALMLAGAQTFSWMIPVIVSAIGIGLFVVSRKSE